MLNKLSGNLELKEEVISLKRELKELRENHNELHSKHDQLLEKSNKIHEDITKIKEEKDNYVQTFTNDLEQINKTKLELEKLTRSFNHLQEKIYNRLYEKMDDSLSFQLKQLRMTTDQYKTLEPETKNVQDQLKLLNEKVSDFLLVADKIKEMDFELKSYKGILERDSSEKIRLQREIDKLKRIIMTERKKNNRYR